MFCRDCKDSFVDIFFFFLGGEDPGGVYVFLLRHGGFVFLLKRLVVFCTFPDVKSKLAIGLSFY